MKAIMSNIRHIPCSEAILLGAPVDKVLSSTLAVFRLLASRLTSLNAHEALFLLENCFSIPKLLYSLRCASCFKSSILSEYDVIQLNVDLSDIIWKQATLPVSSGSLGVRLTMAWLFCRQSTLRLNWPCFCYRVVYTRCLATVILSTLRLA